MLWVEYQLLIVTCEHRSIRIGTNHCLLANWPFQDIIQNSKRKNEQMSGTYGEVHFEGLTKQAQTLLEEVNRIGRGREMVPWILRGRVSSVICPW